MADFRTNGVKKDRMSKKAADIPLFLVAAQELAACCDLKFVRFAISREPVVALDQIVALLSRAGNAYGSFERFFKDDQRREVKYVIRKKVNDTRTATSELTICCVRQESDSGEAKSVKGTACELVMKETSLVQVTWLDSIILARTDLQAANSHGLRNH